MINIKQLDRLVHKIIRIKDVYRQYVVDKAFEQTVLYNGEVIEKGTKWGEDFSYANFEFVYSGKYVNPYIYVESGGVEHLLLEDGHPFGMTDDVPNGKDAHFRCHKYVSLKNVKKGAKIMQVGLSVIVI